MNVVNRVSKEERLTLNQVVILLGIHDTYDSALPQVWVDQMMQLGKDPLGHFVWLYPPQYYLGIPRPLTREGVEMLREYNSAHGTRYETDWAVIEIV